MATKNKNPEIRFKGFTEDWERKQVNDIAPLQRGFDLPVSSVVKGEFPVVMSNGINIFHSEFKVKAPGIVTGRSGTIGNVNYVESNFWPHNTTLWVTDFKGNHPLYIYFLFKKLDLKRFGTGSGVPTLNRNDVHLEKINIPKPTEQKKIGTFFQNLDSLITQHQKKHDKLVILKKAMLAKMFPKNGAKVPEIRFKGFTEDWEEKKVSDLFQVTRGNVLSATETVVKQNEIMPYPVYSSQTKNNGLMGYYKNYLFENAITWTTDGANAGTVNYRAGKFYSTNVNGVLLSDEGFANKSIAEIINRIAWKHVSRVGNPKLMNNVMGEIKILIPNSVKEQNYISVFLENLDSQLSLHQTQLSKLNNIKKACLSKMFVTQE